MIPRSYLFVPGDDPEKLEKAWTRGADALIVDLEDAVTADRKEHARSAVAQWLSYGTRGVGELWIRVNNDESFAADLAAIAHPRLTGVVVPKVRDAGEARNHGQAVAGLKSGEHAAVGYFPMIETPRAMIEADAIASAPGVVTMMIGEYDFAAELGLTLTPEGDEMLAYRARLVLACAAAGIRPPVAPVDADFTDLGAFRTSTTRLRGLGFVGRATIHPAQIAVANDVFTPSPDELTRARSLIEVHERAVTEGRAVSTDDQGRLVDEAILRRARRILKLGQEPT